MQFLEEPGLGRGIAPRCHARATAGGTAAPLNAARTAQRAVPAQCDWFLNRWNARSGLQSPDEVGRRGFTLIELMVVVVLIGIMAAMIVPEMKGTYEDALLRSTCRKLVSAFSMASSRAVSLNQLHRVHLDRGTGKYAIERKVSAREQADVFVAVRDVPGGEGELDTRISIEFRRSGEEPLPAGSDAAPPGEDPQDPAQMRDRDEAIAFYPDGTADAGDVVLQDREGFRLALRINPITARVRVIELNRK